MAKSVVDQNEVEWIEESFSDDSFMNSSSQMNQEEFNQLKNHLRKNKGKFNRKTSWSKLVATGERRADEIRKKKLGLFLKMLLTARTTMTPWIDVDDVKEVRDEIYNSIAIKKTEFAENPRYSKIVQIEVSENDPQVAINSINSLTFARNKLAAWKCRCRNIARSQIVMSHLTSLESILNVLIEEFNSDKRSGRSNRFGDMNSSMLYSLYSIGVINFCNALTSYPSEYNIDITMGNIAVLFECPVWIINCRHSLSHPSANPPKISILKEAITFALEWMDRFFFSKATSVTFEEKSAPATSSRKYKITKAKTREKSPKKTKQAVQSSVVGSNSTLNFGPPKPTAACQQIHHETCLLLFTSCPNNRADIKKNIQKYMLVSPNEFIRSFAEILTFGAPLHEKLIMGDFTLPALLLRRSSRIFGLIFSSLPSDQMIILLLNLLIDIMITTESRCNSNTIPQQDLEATQRALHSARCWLVAIMESLTTGMNTDGVPNRRTIFQKSFDFFGDLVALKRRHTFDWVRMFYRFVHLECHQKSVDLATNFYHLLDHNVINDEKFQQIVKLIEVKTCDRNLKNTSHLNAEVKTIDHLKNATHSKDAMQLQMKPMLWDFPIGSRIKLNDENDQQMNETITID